MDKTMSSILEFLNDFSIKKIAIILFIMFLIGIGLVFYEWLTDSNSLKKLEKANSILIEIEKMATLTTEQEQLIQGIRATILRRLEETLVDDGISLVLKTSEITISLDKLLKFIFGGLFYFITTIVLLVKYRKKPENNNTIIGVCFVGIFFGIVGIFIPQFWWPWFHIFGIPLIAMIFIMIFAMIVYRKEKNKVEI